MKIKIGELKGAALDWAAGEANPFIRDLVVLDDDAARRTNSLRHLVAAHTDGDTVEVPDELVEVKA